jgi:plastocyanin
MKPIHGQPKPQNVPSDMTDTPPVPCAFKVGDKVTFTNDNGVAFHNHTIRGFTKEVTSWGAFIYHCTDAWWHPSKPENFKLSA